MDQMEGGAAAGCPLGLMAPTSITSLARDARARAREEHVNEVAAIGRRMAALGLDGVVDASKLDRALGPVPDKAYLECVSRLPLPGAHLVSRPGVARAATTTARSSSSKKKGSSKKTAKK